TRAKPATARPPASVMTGCRAASRLADRHMPPETARRSGVALWPGIRSTTERPADCARSATERPVSRAECANPGRVDDANRDPLSRSCSITRVAWGFRIISTIFLAMALSPLVSSELPGKRRPQRPVPPREASGGAEKAARAHLRQREKGGGRLPLMRGWSEREPTFLVAVCPEVMDTG